ETGLLVATFEQSEAVLLAVDSDGTITERARNAFPSESITEVLRVELSSDGSQLLVSGGLPTLARGAGNCHLALCRVSQDAIIDCRQVYSNQCGGDSRQRLSWINGDGPPVAIGVRPVG